MEVPLHRASAHLQARGARGAGGQGSPDGGEGDDDSDEWETDGESEYEDS